MLRLGLTVAVLIPMALLAEAFYHRMDPAGAQPVDGEELVEQ